MDKVAVITDPHGCFLTYLALKKKVRKKFPNIRFCVSGDIPDRGKRTRELVNHVLEEGDDWLKGNHEDLMAHWIHIEGRWVEIFDIGYNVWLYNGGYETLVSYGYDSTRKRFAHKEEFLEHQQVMEELPYYKEYKIFDDQGRTLLATHSSAQKVWNWPEEKRKEHTKLFNSHLIWERSPNPLPIKDVYNVFGHTPDWNRVTEHFANIDTGCVFKHEEGYGVLSCFIWPDKLVIQQPNID